MGSRYNGGTSLSLSKDPSSPPLPLNDTLITTPSGPGDGLTLEPYCWEKKNHQECRCGSGGHRLLNLLVKCQGKLFPFFRFTGRLVSPSITYHCEQ